MNYFKFHIGDYAKKCGRLTMLEHGAYTQLIQACYDRERFPTSKEAMDWTWARSDSEITAVEFVLNRFFTLEDGVYVQNRIKDEIVAYNAVCAKNAEIAQKREGGRKNGKSRSVNEACIDSNEAGTSGDEACTSGDEACTKHHLTTNHKPLTNNQENKITDVIYVQADSANRPPAHTPEQAHPRASAGAKRDNPSKPITVSDLVKSLEGLSEAVAGDYLGYRKQKKSPLTAAGWRVIASEITKSSASPDEALSEAMAAGWTGFRATWLENRNQPRASSSPQSAHQRQNDLIAQNNEVARQAIEKYRTEAGCTLVDG